MLESTVTTSTMHDLIAAHASYLREERGRGPATMKSYLTMLTDFVVFLACESGEGVIPLAGVDKAKIVDFLKLRGGSEDPSRSLWNSRLAALRSLYSYLVKQGKIAVSPAHQVDRLRTMPKEPVPPSMDEYLALVDAMKTASPIYRTRNVALVEVLFHSALRVAELVSLGVDQVDLQNHVFLAVKTKGGKELAKPFSDLLAAALEAYLADRQKLRPAEGEGALFVSNRGTRLRVRYLRFTNDSELNLFSKEKLPSLGQTGAAKRYVPSAWRILVGNGRERGRDHLA